MEDIEKGYELLAADTETKAIDDERKKNRTAKTEDEIKAELAKQHIKYVDEVFNHIGFHNRLSGDEVNKLIYKLKALIKGQN